jgi:hypothetical protein
MSAHAREVFEEYFAPDVMFHRLAECCHSVASQGETGPRKFYFVSRPFATAALAHFTSRARVAAGKVKRKIRPQP